ncbi:MAG: sodium:solute symporter [Parachlamydiaceae bacterium]|nr:sodium:solute symporter [Parachlamydiaceae bacterium]
MAEWDYLVLFALSFIFVAIGFSTRFKNESSYLVADRKTGFFALTATLVMTEFNTATLLSFASLGYLSGLWGLIMPFIFLIGLVFYALTVAKKWKSFNGLSVAAFFSKRYGKDLGKLVSIILLVSMSGFSATYVKSLAILFNPIFPFMSEWQLSGVLVCLILAITLRGGLFAIIYTDMISFVLTLLFFPIMLFYVWKSNSVSLHSISLISVVNDGSKIIPPSFVISLIVLTMFTYILAPWYGQKIFSAKSEKVAYLSVFTAAIVIFCLYGLVILPASLLHLNGIQLSNPEQALPYILQQIMPFGLRGLGYGILFAASASTLTGVWNAMAAMCVSDFLDNKIARNKNRTWIITISFASISYLLSNIFVDKIFSKLILANIPIAALSFALLAGFYWEKASRLGAYCSIIIGIAWGVGAYFWWGEAGEYTWYWAMGGIPFTFLAGILGSYYYPRTDATALIKI